MRPQSAVGRRSVGFAQRLERRDGPGDQVVEDDRRLAVGGDGRVDLRALRRVGVAGGETVDVGVAEVVAATKELLGEARRDRDVDRGGRLIRAAPADRVEHGEGVAVALGQRELRLGAEGQDLLEEVVVGFEGDQRLLAQDVGVDGSTPTMVASLRLIALMEV
jgi:hypothetical protein